MKTWKTNVIQLCASVCLLLSGPVSAYPTKPIQLVLPYGAGPSDLLARTMASCMSTHMGQPIVVHNRPGANGLLAANSVKSAQADGHTIMLGASALVTGLVTSANPTLDVRRDLEAITKLAVGVQGIYVNSELPISSVKELVAYAKSNPGKMNYATVGVGSVNHLATEAFAQVADIDIVHIPYPQGTGPFLSALMAGEVQMAITDLAGAQGAVDSGRVRLVGVMGRERQPSRPAVPAVVETLPEMAAHTGTLWYGFFAPPKTPATIMAVIRDAVEVCAKEDGVRATFAKAGYEENQIITNSPDAFSASIVEDINRLREVVKRANIQLI